MHVSGTESRCCKELKVTFPGSPKVPNTYGFPRIDVEHHHCSFWEPLSYKKELE